VLAAAGVLVDELAGAAVAGAAAAGLASVEPESEPEVDSDFASPAAGGFAAPLPA